ncbi:ABC transporter permease subunit [Kibdelosporangium phytohabitans]|uniref:Branched-chain amino acid ABC transporter permease n=1 Tax=Kibdelosporangium phytohabitans TaxID=860235 RepID=A0A0N9HPE3_9PSEU|nr:hypothetical protein [Kibdelosporangium phytohabitans]ALG08862.1 hypothetical protein AOZ06_19830 [Kibdelosporangium phytohabitans]MBE1469988.1 branched-subunit amino acid ABC-type transport system permease component [Kibdelosporangium phytohabitans]
MGAWLDASLVGVVNGFAIGFLLFIVAVGLSLVFGMMDVLNLAHGAIFLLGAYAGAALAGGAPTWAASSAPSGWPRCSGSQAVGCCRR